MTTDPVGQVVREMRDDAIRQRAENRPGTADMLDAWADRLARIGDGWRLLQEMRAAGDMSPYWCGRMDVAENTPPPASRSMMKRHAALKGQPYPFDENGNPASREGGDPMTPFDRCEFALRDAGFDYDEAFRVAHLAYGTTPEAGGLREAVAVRYRFRVERPDGSGSEWTDWRLADNAQEADYGIPTGRSAEIEALYTTPPAGDGVRVPDELVDMLRDKANELRAAGMKFGLRSLHEAADTMIEARRLLMLAAAPGKGEVS